MSKKHQHPQLKASSDLLSAFKHFRKNKLFIRVLEKTGAVLPVRARLKPRGPGLIFSAVSFTVADLKVFYFWVQ